MSNNNFHGSINGVTIKKISKGMEQHLKKANYKTPKEVCDYIKETLVDEEIDDIQFPIQYFEKVFDQDRKGHIKLELSKQDDLYSDSNIAGFLSYLADWILTQDRAAERNNPYNYHNLKKLLKRIQKDLNASLSFFERTTQNEFESNTLRGIDRSNMINPWNMNESKFKKYVMSWYDKFFVDDKDIIKFYYEFREGVIANRNELRELKKQGKLSHSDNKKLKVLNDYVYSTKGDIIHIIENRQLKFNRCKNEEGTPKKNYVDERFDLEIDEKAIFNLLKMTPDENYSLDLNVMLWDLQSAIDKTELSNNQKEILKLYRNDLSQGEIADELDMTQGNVSRQLKKISEKIYKNGNNIR